MASFCKHASLTIAATAARNGTDIWKAAADAIRHIDSLQCRLTPLVQLQESCTSVGRERNPEETIFEGPLNRRGWVLQEHLLSRQRVHLSAGQVIQECDKMSVSEDRSDV